MNESEWKLKISWKRKHETCKVNKTRQNNKQKHRARSKKQHKTHEVEIVKGSELLNDIERIDYIKCDIEGYEVVVFEEIKAVISQHKPIVQIEIGPENEKKMFDYFNSLNYVQYGISKFKIVKENPGKQEEQGDFLFIHEKKEADFVERMKNKKMI